MDLQTEDGMEQLILASGSPRRSELLSRIGLPFEVVVSGTDESQEGHDDAVSYAVAMSANKANEVAGMLAIRQDTPGRMYNGAGFLVLAADTVVARHGHILGKPVNREDAFRMLSLLSGGWHDVITALTILRTQTGQTVTETETTRVLFRELDVSLIERYLATGEAFDKAGAYGVQGYGSLLVERMDGDYYNVMGLPLHRLSRMLERVGVSPYSWLEADARSRNPTGME
jgi:septum formation protein